MKSSVCLFLLLAGPLGAVTTQQIIPAGSMVQCTVSEPKLSSKTEDVGDPILCRVSHLELYGRSVFPYGTYLVGRFEDYKDPGHFVGKGWMELKFERMMLPPDQVLPISAKVVYVPKYQVDKHGDIHGKGHATRDVVEWSIPILWPIDFLSLPRRGPRPVLKEETRLTLKLMDDVVLPGQTEAAAPTPNSSRDSYGFTQRPPEYRPQSYIPQPSYAPQQYYAPQYVQQSAPVAPMRVAYYAPPAPTRPITVLMLRDGTGRLANDYWFEGGVQIRYISLTGQPVVIPMAALDLENTVQINWQRGVPVVIRSVGWYGY